MNSIRSGKKLEIFAKKNPRTAGQIDSYLDETRILEEIAAKSKDSKISEAFAHADITEYALRPLISIKDPKVHDAIAQHLIKLIAEKDAEKPIIKRKEVQQIINQYLPHEPKTIGEAHIEQGSIQVLAAQSSTAMEAAPIVTKPKKITIEDGQIIFSATVEKLRRDGFDLVDVYHFYLNAMNKDPTFNAIFKELFPDSSVSRLI